MQANTIRVKGPTQFQSKRMKNYCLCFRQRLEKLKITTCTKCQVELLTDRNAGKVVEQRIVRRVNDSEIVPGVDLNPEIIRQKKLYNRLLYQQSPKRILYLMQKFENDMNHFTVAAAARALGHLVPNIRSNSYLHEQCIEAYAELIYFMFIHYEQMHIAHVMACMWSLAKSAQHFQLHEKIGQFDKIFSRLSQVAVDLRYEMTVSQLAQISWAMARVKWYDWKQIKPILYQLMETNCKSNAYNGQDVANIMWALVHLNCKDLHVIGHISDFAKQRVTRMTPDEVAIVMWSLKQLRFFDNSLFTLIEDLISSYKWKFSSQNISNICLTLAAFRQNAKGNMIKVLTDQFINLRKYQKQHIVNIIYSLSVLGCQTSIVQQIVDKMIEDIYIRKKPNQKQVSTQIYNNFNENDLKESNFSNQIISNGDQVQNLQNSNDLNYNEVDVMQIDEKYHGIYDQFQQRELCQLRLSYLLYQIHGKENLILPEDLLIHCMHAQQKQAKDTLYKENDLIPKVFEVVKQKYPHAQERVLICNGEFQIHICICGHTRKNELEVYDANNVYDGRSRKVALEVFSSKSFVLNRQNLVIGYALSKLELLVGFGWRVVIVSSFEWDDEGYQEQMLKIIEKALTED